MPTTTQLQRMVHRALKDKAPKLHMELSNEGALDKFVNHRVVAIEEAVRFAVNEANHKAGLANLGFQDRVQSVERAKRAALEQAVSENLEFLIEEESP